MKTTIENLSNERLEQEISNIYWTAAKEAPGVTLKETGNLGLLWEEFDERLEVGAISPDTDYEAPTWREGFYE